MPTVEGTAPESDPRVLSRPESKVPVADKPGVGCPPLDTDHPCFLLLHHRNDYPRLPIGVPLGVDIFLIF
jgi:hypothetical protein